MMRVFGIAEHAIDSRSAVPAKGTRLVLQAVCGLVLLAAAWSACQHAAPKESAPILAADALVPSPRLIVGRILAVDTAQGFAFVELAADAPVAATTDGADLMTRTPDLRETGRLRASRYVRGRTLGAKILGGQPTAGDEVVWLAP